MSDEHLRMSDAEREAAAAELGDHYAQGRLTTDEYTDRLDRIWAARTHGELAPLFRDLPGRYGPPVRNARPTARRTTYWSGGVAPFRRGLPTPVFVVLAILIVLTIATHLPLILAGALVWFFVLARHRKGSSPSNWSRSLR